MSAAIHATWPGSVRGSRFVTLEYPPSDAREMERSETKYFPALIMCSTRSRDPRLAS